MLKAWPHQGVIAYRIEVVAIVIVDNHLRLLGDGVKADHTRTVSQSIQRSVASGSGVIYQAITVTSTSRGINRRIRDDPS